LFEEKEGNPNRPGFDFVKEKRTKDREARSKEVVSNARTSLAEGK